MSISFKTLVGAGLGWAFMGPLGAIIGGIIGSKLDDNLVPGSSRNQGGFNPMNAGRQKQTGPGDFYASLIIIFSHVIKSDDHVKRDEIEYVRSYLNNNISDPNMVRELMFLLEQVLQRPVQIDEVGRQIASYMDFPSRIQLVHLLFGLSLADGELVDAEKNAIRQISFLLGLNEQDYQSIYSSYHQKDSNAAYKILEVSPDAENEEIKQAYKKMAMLYHPDKVSHLGPDLVKTAEEKFKTINEAYTNIRRTRGF